MKIFNRAFTLTEKLLIAVLILILLALVYYQFVDKTVRDVTTSAKIEAESLEDEIQKIQQEATKLRTLQDKMDQLEAEGRLSWMSSYNGSKAEVAFLNDVLADTLAYSIEFSNVTRKGNQIRRSFRLRYQTFNFRLARAVLTELLGGENRCLVGDMKCTINNFGITTVEAQATFYETMVEGTPDAGLPSDSAAANK